MGWPNFNRKNLAGATILRAARSMVRNPKVDRRLNAGMAAVVLLDLAGWISLRGETFSRFFGTGPRKATTWDFACLRFKLYRSFLLL
jgi:hypothetical protein